jgi:protein TonB
VPVIDAPALDPPAISAPIVTPTFDPTSYELRATAVRSSPGSSSSTGSHPTPIHDAKSVDRQVEPRAGNPVPRYPLALSSAGIGGRVIAQFVVDSLGAVDRGSLRVLMATHALFERSVRDAIVRMRFAPAEVGSRKVAQLVEMPFHFEIKR